MGSDSINSELIRTVPFGVWTLADKLFHTIERQWNKLLFDLLKWTIEHFHPSLCLSTNISNNRRDFWHFIFYRDVWAITNDFTFVDDSGCCSNMKESLIFESRSISISGLHEAMKALNDVIIFSPFSLILLQLARQEVANVTFTAE